MELAVEYSEKFLQSLPCEHLDFVCVDAGHCCEITFREQKLTTQKMRKGGLIFGDYNDPDPISSQHGVCFAL